MIATLAVASSAWAQGPPPAADATGARNVLTLEMALARASVHSPLIAAAQERQRAATAAQALVTPAPNPFVDVRGENLGPVSSGRLPRDVFATISQPVELGGKRAARQSIAAAATALASADVSTAERTISVEVVDTYFDAVRARDLRASLIEQQLGVAEIVTLLRQRVREGLSAEADLRKFETEHTTLRISIARTTVSLESALIRLGTLVGEPLEAERVTTPLVPIPGRSAAVTATDVASRPDVTAAHRRLARAESQLAGERAKGVPDLTVTAGYKRTSGFDTGVAGVTIPLALFDRNRAAVAQAAGDVAAARADLTAVIQRAMADAAARLVAARQLSEQAARSDQELVAPATVVRAAARAAFIEGRGDVLQLVDAERVFGDAAREVLELRLDALHAAIHARIALGETPLP